KTRHIEWRLAADTSGAAEVVLTGYDATDDRELAARVRRSEKLAAVGTLAAGLAHEIRNPLNGAQLHLKFLERGLAKSSADPDMRAAASVVADEIKRLGKLVDDFLDFARPHRLERASIDAATLCARAAGLVAARAAAANVELACDLP